MPRMLSSIQYLPFVLASAHALTLPLYNASGVVFQIKQKPIVVGVSTYANEGQYGSTAARPANPFKDATFPDAIFVETLKIGTPPRDIVLQMDTGSWQL